MKLIPPPQCVCSAGMSLCGSPQSHCGMCTKLCGTTKKLCGAPQSFIRPPQRLMRAPQSVVPTGTSIMKAPPSFIPVGTTFLYAPPCLIPPCAGPMQSPQRCTVAPHAAMPSVASKEPAPFRFDGRPFTEFDGGLSLDGSGPRHRRNGPRARNFAPATCSHALPTRSGEVEAARECALQCVGAPASIQP
jgi:hypothetical protein